MSKLTETIRKKLSTVWGTISPVKAVVAEVSAPTVETIVAAAEAGDAEKLEELMAQGGGSLFKSSDRGGLVDVPASALYIVNNASPAGFDLLMARPEVDTLAKKIYLRNAVYHNKPELAEILMKDPAVADKKELQNLLESEYVVHGLAENRAALGKMLVKYGADNAAAKKTVEDAASRREQERATAWEARVNKFGAAVG